MEITPLSTRDFMSNLWQIKPRIYEAQKQEGANWLEDVDCTIQQVIDGTYKAFLIDYQTILITEVRIFPKARVLNVIVLSGKISDWNVFWKELSRLAKRANCQMIMSSGRSFVGVCKRLKLDYQSATINLVKI